MAYYTQLDLVKMQILIQKVWMGRGSYISNKLQLILSRNIPSEIPDLGTQAGRLGRGHVIFMQSRCKKHVELRVYLKRNEGNEGIQNRHLSRRETD